MLFLSVIRNSGNINSAIAEKCAGIVQHFKAHLSKFNHPFNRRIIKFMITKTYKYFFSLQTF